MKRFVMMLLPALMVLCFSCVGFTPSSAVKNLIVCIQNGNYDKAAENLASDPDATAEQIAQDKKMFVASLKEKADKEFAKNGGIESYKIVDESVTPDESKAYVRISYTFKNGTSADEIIPLVKSGAAWKYVLSK